MDKPKIPTVAMIAACPFPANRGTPSRIFRMAEGLSDNGVKVIVITYHLGLDSSFRNFEIERIPKIPYNRYIPGPNFTKLSLLDPLLFLKTLKVVSSRKVNLIHAHHFEGFLVSYLVSKLRAVKIIYDAHTTLQGELPYYNFQYPNALAFYLDKKVPYWADHIIAVSHTLKDFFLKFGIDQTKIDVIPTGVNIDFFEKGNPDMIKSRHGIYNKLIVMYTGSLTKYQGIHYLIESMQKVLQVFTDSILMLVGYADNEEFKEACIKHGIRDRVIFTGEKPFEEIPHYLAAADVVVNPRVECPGTPQKLVNYMAAEKAIVSFEGSAKLLVNGINAMVVEDANCFQMADQIIKLLGNRLLRETLGKNAKETLVGRYDWDSLSRRVKEIYYKLMGG